MKNRRDTAITAAKDGKKRTAGFTLIELIVAITVFGILCAAAAVNWASFSKYQNLRADAHSFHKDLMALKAKAIEDADTLTVTFNGNGYTAVNNANNTVKTGTFTGSTTVDPACNWQTITIKNENLAAFTTPNDNTDSLFVVLSNGSNKAFRIVRARDNVNLILQYKSGTTWHKI